MLSFAKRGPSASPPEDMAEDSPMDEATAEEGEEEAEAPMIPADAELCCPHCGEYFPAAKGVMPATPMASAPDEVEDETDGQLGYTFRGARS